MLTPSIKLGEANGVDFEITVGWISILMVLTATLWEPEAYDRYLELVNLLTLGQITINPAFPQSQLGMIGFTVSVLIGIYLSVTLHEIGHATAARNAGINVKSITLWVAGGVAKIETIPSTKEIPITIAGPAVTFILVPAYALVSAVLFTLNLTTIAWIFLLLALFNALMLIFNLLPLFPLDGGRILRSLLTRKTSYLNATKYAFYTTATVVTVAITLMITFGNYDYIFMSGAIGFLSYISYKNFQETYKPDNIVKPDDFYIYEHTFVFDPKTITDRQKENLTTYIIKQGGEVTQNNGQADYIVSEDPLDYQQKPDTNHLHPLLLVHKLDQNGATYPPEFENQFKQ